MTEPAGGVDALQLPFVVLLAFLLLRLARHDLRTYLLPDREVAAVAVLGLVHAKLRPFHGLDLVDCLEGGLAFGAVLLAYRRFFAWRLGREALGLGDVKLAGAGGLWIGWQGIPAAMLIAALAGLALMLWRNRRRWRAGRRFVRMVAFGPALAIAVAALCLLDAAGLVIGPTGPAAWMAP